jgi:hypothetical protein
MSLDRGKAPIVTSTELAFKTHTSDAAQSSTPVRVVDFDVPFGSMVVLIIKWTLAAVPALLILAVIGAVVFAVLGGLLGGLSS